MISDDGCQYVHPYYPEGVKHILTTGGNHYIGFVDENTILKYPHFKVPWPALDVESLIYKQLGKHDSIIGFKGKHEEGVLLEYAPKGSLYNYIADTGLTGLTEHEKIRLAREIAEGVAHAHSRSVIICNINLRNVLLDDALHAKLCGFQGRLLGPDGKVLHDGGSCELADSFMPRQDNFSASFVTDIFALGSTVYHIMTGHEPFPELDVFKDEAEFRRRYQQGHFPPMDTLLAGKVILGCWKGEYASAGKVAEDLSLLETRF